MEIVLFVYMAALIVYTVLHPIASWIHVSFVYPLFVRHRLQGTPEFKVNVLVPCHGLDEHLERNLRAVAAQDYSNCRVTYITDTEDDPAVPVIRDILRDFPHTRHLVAGYNDGNCSQLNHVQVAAIRQDEDSEIFVKCDSDMQPERLWLRELLRPFLSSRVQVVSTHHWVSPQKYSFGGYLYAALAGYLTMLMGSPLLNWVWGGCWVIRRRTFQELGMGEIWIRTGTDDATLQNRLSRFHIRPVFVPTCVATTHEAIPTVKQVVRWFRRQSFYGKIYLRPFWLISLIWESLVALGIAGSAAAIIGQLAVLGRLDTLGWAGVTVLACVMASGLLVKLPYRKRKDIALSWWALLPLVGHFLIAYTLWSTALMSKVVWRGNTYAFNRDGSIRLFSRVGR